LRIAITSTIERSMKARIRCIGVAIAICSWFALSNHCAFAALATKTEPAQTGCPFHSKPKEKPSTGAQCCKILRAVAPVTAKSWARDDAQLSDFDNDNSESMFTVAYSQTALAPLSLDTGPPGLRSFAEMILQRSLLAHAPPIVA
jgi:hypothetical protein